ncbi:hypothetical protein ScPMuIL_003058 [Solemya velum]
MNFKIFASFLLVFGLIGVCIHEADSRIYRFGGGGGGVRRNGAGRDHRPDGPNAGKNYKSFVREENSLNEK